jgi:hypothetical protein
MWNKSGLKDIPNKLQQFGNTAVNKVSHMSTTQKVVGGTLLALGAGWIATRNTKQGKDLMSRIQTQGRNLMNKNKA